MPRSHMQTARDKTKALRQYEALKRSGMVVKAIVVTELKDGSFHILGSELLPFEIGGLLLIASEALVQADAQRQVVRLVGHIEPARRGVHNGLPPRARRITTGRDGNLVPPKGENFISCGECNHPHWFILHDDKTDRLTGYACTHCGNEIENLMVTHAPGQA